jgi:sRNA-binding carbon storage regulator CsrA
LSAGSGRARKPFSKERRMLVLDQEKDAPVILTLPDGRRCKVVVIRVKNTHKVKIGYDFPEDVKIHRRVVQDLIDQKEHDEWT